MRWKMECRIECYPNVKYFELDFGEVEVGVTKIKSIRIVNQSDKTQLYIVHKDSQSNPLDSVFNTVEYTWSLLPCESYVCDISYRPILPNRKYTDYFFVTDTHECCYKIIVQGFCIGPNVTSSTTRLIMVCNNTHCRTQKCFKLTNRANVCAKFMFDIDIAQCPFKINEVSGVIKSLSSKCFTISFEPADVGIYKYYMTCLILNQIPIILELYGIRGCDSDQKYIQTFQSRIENIQEFDVTNNFRHYMRDITTAVKSNPPSISLSWSFIDFGQAEIGMENFGKRTPQTVCLTNHNSFNLRIIWEKDTSKAFSIRPQEANIRGNQSIIFEVRFDPAEERTFYAKELIARTFRLPCCETLIENPDNLLMNVIPEFISIRLIGHTFSHGFNDWMPQYEIPETVTMPACIPALPVYTTFIIKNFGQQPLMFCFIPPDTSHYSIKPMMGLISHTQEYQTIAVELFPEAAADCAYVERWAVRLNGNPANEIYLDFQGFAEQASLVFGEENVVILDPVHRGCRHVQSVPVRNATRHCVRFEYLSCDFPRELCIQQMNGVIHPNETVFHNWIFTPDELKNYDFDISCRLSAETSRITLIKIEVSGNSTEGSLIAIPEELDFGERAYKELCEMEFKVFNFSTVTIHFLLVCRPSKKMELMEDPENDVNISPIRGTVRPGKGEKVKICLTPTQPGFYSLNIQYYLIPDSKADGSIPLSKPKSLCMLNCMCYLPLIQIKDLLYQAETNKVVSKISLWKSLGIDDFNSALKDLLPSQETSIEMIVPFATLEENEKFVIKLLLKNVNPIKALWFLKKQSICLCNDPSRKNRPIVKRISKGDCLYCVHDQSCTINPKKITLMADETDILTIEIKSDTLQPSGIFWDLSIGEERYITLNIKLESPMILSGSYLNFKNVYLGQCTSMRYQAVWLYNNKEYENTYKVDTESLASINKKNYGIIFTCLNPQGTIRRYTCKPVLFGFCPNRFGKFKATVVVRLGENESTLNIEAESTCIFKQIDISHETCPLVNTFKIPEIVVYFNNDCIIVPSVPTHGKVTKVIMIHNHHQQDVLYYEWKNYEIPGIVKINVKPTSGLIQPQTLLTFMIEIVIGSYECSLDIDIFCDFVDVSERRLAEKKKAEQENILKRMENEFTITEKGIIYPKKPIFDEIKKPSTFCKTLTLKIYTYDSQFADDKVDLLQQLKNIPNEEIKHEMTSSKYNISSHVINMSSQIFESIIWDIINSKCFAKTLEENINSSHSLKYSQLPTNIIERKYQSERTHLLPPKRYIEDILHTMMSMVVHKEFNFETAHFSQPSDARQISYQKTYMMEALSEKTNYTKNCKLFKI